MKLKTLILIATILSTVTRADVLLYDEPQNKNATGTFATERGPIGTSIDLCSYNNPYSGQTCIEGTHVPFEGRFAITFGGTGWIYPQEFTAFVYHIFQKTANSGRINIHVYGDTSSSTQVGFVSIAACCGMPNSYGFLGSNVTSYQTITIPIADFNFPPGVAVNRFSFDLAGGAPAGFYIDDIYLVGNGVVHYANPYPPATQ